MGVDVQTLIPVEVCLRLMDRLFEAPMRVTCSDGGSGTMSVPGPGASADVVAECSKRYILDHKASRLCAQVAELDQGLDLADGTKVELAGQSFWLEWFPTQHNEASRVRVAALINILISGVSGEAWFFSEHPTLEVYECPLRVGFDLTFPLRRSRSFRTEGPKANSLPNFARLRLDEWWEATLPEGSRDRSELVTRHQAFVSNCFGMVVAFCTLKSAGLLTAVLPGKSPRSIQFPDHIDLTAPCDDADGPEALRNSSGRTSSPAASAQVEQTVSDYLAHMATANPQSRRSTSGHESSHLEVPIAASSHRLSGRTPETSQACPLCGNHSGVVSRTIIKRGFITLRLDPAEVCWKDEIVPLTPFEADMLALLICRGRVSFEVFDDACAKRGSSQAAREVMLCRIRRKFTAAGAPNPIKTIRGWGLTFRQGDGAEGSRSVLIGAAEACDAELQLYRQ